MTKQGSGFSPAYPYGNSLHSSRTERSTAHGSWLSLRDSFNSDSLQMLNLPLVESWDNSICNEKIGTSILFCFTVKLNCIFKSYMYAICLCFQYIQFTTTIKPRGMCSNKEWGAFYLLITIFFSITSYRTTCAMNESEYRFVKLLQSGGIACVRDLQREQIMYVYKITALIGLIHTRHFGAQYCHIF